MPHAVTRREFVGWMALGAVSAACTRRTPVLPVALPGAAHYPFTLGGRRMVALLDGTGVYPASRYVANAGPDERNAALARHGVTDPERIRSPYACLAIDDQKGGWMLIDTGLGARSADVGHLPQALAAAGIAPASVRTVVLTHGHPDHIGGNVDAAGALAFPDARFVMWDSEWRFWTDDANLAKVPASWAETARRNLPPIRDRLDLLTGEAEVAPGIRVVPAGGHTPGHCAVEVSVGREQLLYTSDAALHPIHLERPDWYPTYDMDPARALESKRRLFDRAADAQARVLAFHFWPFPALGRVTRQGTGWRWSPDPVA